MLLTAKDQARFWKFVPVTPESPEACWLWVGSRKKAGYGQFMLRHEHRRTSPSSAHRVSWVLHHGRQIPPGAHICHHCDTPACVRPSHLFLGTAQANADDRVAKGRGPRPMVPAPRAAPVWAYLAAQGVSEAEVARRLGVSRERVRQIRLRPSWGSLWRVAQAVGVELRVTAGVPRVVGRDADAELGGL